MLSSDISASVHDVSRVDQSAGLPRTAAPPVTVPAKQYDRQLDEVDRLPVQSRR